MDEYIQLPDDLPFPVTLPDDLPLPESWITLPADLPLPAPQQEEQTEEEEVVLEYVPLPPKKCTLTQQSWIGTRRVRGMEFFTDGHILIPTHLLSAKTLMALSKRFLVEDRSVIEVEAAHVKQIWDFGIQSPTEVFPTSMEINGKACMVWMYSSNGEHKTLVNTYKFEWLRQEVGATRFFMSAKDEPVLLQNADGQAVALLMPCRW